MVNCQVLPYQVITQPTYSQHWSQTERPQTLAEGTIRYLRSLHLFIQSLLHQYLFNAAHKQEDRKHLLSEPSVSTLPIVHFFQS